MSENWEFVALAYGAVWLVLGAFRLYVGARRREAAEFAGKEGGLR